jgi:NitT/TauT family transport system substrate-binding protein
MVWGTGKFRRENPKTYQAVFDAFKEATESINKDNKRAAEIYVESVHGKASLDSILKMLNDPEIKYTLAPEGIMQFVQFMNKAGTLKSKAASWKDLFFPEAHNLPGT